MRPDGSEQQQVLQLPGEILTPAESPDTRSVAFTFTSAQTHVSEVWVAQADGSLPHKLVGASRSATTRSGQSIQGAVHPSWSPDGGSIAFASTDSGRFEVGTMASDGSAAHQLIDGSGGGYPDSNVPEYSLDGTGITYWSGYESQYGEVWIMAADGSGQRRLTDTPDPESADNPTWSPDGRFVVFISNRAPAGPQPTTGVNAWVVAAGGGEPRMLLQNVSYCAWAPAEAGR